MRSECPSHSSGESTGTDRHASRVKAITSAGIQQKCQVARNGIGICICICLLEPPHQDGTQSTPYTAPTGPHVPILLVTRVSGPP